MNDVRSTPRNIKPTSNDCCNYAEDNFHFVSIISQQPSIPQVLLSKKRTEVYYQVLKPDNAVEPLHNGHLENRTKWPLCRGSRYGEVGV